MTGRPISSSASSIASTASPRATPSGRLKEMRHRGNYALVVDGEGASSVQEMVKRAKRHPLPLECANVNVFQGLGSTASIAARPPSRRDTDSAAYTWWTTGACPKAS